MTREEETLAERNRLCGTIELCLVAYGHSPTGKVTEMAAWPLNNPNWRVFDNKNPDINPGGAEAVMFGDGTFGGDSKFVHGTASGIRKVVVELERRGWRLVSIDTHQGVAVTRISAEK